MAKDKWVKQDSSFATGSRGRVTRNIAAQRKAVEPTAAQKRAANPQSKADKSAKRR